MTRRTALAILTTVVIVAVLVVATLPAFAQRGQNRPGGQRDLMGDMLYLERSWTAVSFQLECTEEQINQLKPTYASALETRSIALQEAMQNGDRQAYVQAITDCKSTLEAKLNEVLTDEQLAELEKILTPVRRQGGGQGRPRGGQQ